MDAPQSLLTFVCPRSSAVKFISINAGRKKYTMLF